MATLAQSLATLLNIVVGQENGKPVFQVKRGPVIHTLGLAHHAFPKGEAPINSLTLAEAVTRATEVMPADAVCQYLVVPFDSPRREIYMEIESEIMRVERTEGEYMVDAIAHNDPREAVSLVMDQLRDCAMALAKPHNFLVAMLRTAVLGVTAYQWAVRWIATLQKAPLEKSIIQLPSNSRLHTFQVPPKVIEEPKPLTPLPPPLATDSGFDEEAPKNEA